MDRGKEGSLARGCRHHPESAEGGLGRDQCASGPRPARIRTFAGDVLWDFVDGVSHPELLEKHGGGSGQTKESDAMSRELKRLGFKFVGSTICYAFMQAVGMVNDHTVDCYRRHQVAVLSKVTGKG